MEMVQRELESVEAEAATALAALMRKNEALSEAQTELRRFAARVERARKEAKLRRAPPTKPLDSDAVRKRGAKSHARPNATTPPR